MSDRPEQTQPTLLQLLEELERLQDEQRTLDLRDSAAVEECHRKIDALRQKIQLLGLRRGGPMKGGGTPARPR